MSLNLAAFVLNISILLASSLPLAMAAEENSSDNPGSSGSGAGQKSSKVSSSSRVIEPDKIASLNHQAKIELDAGKVSEAAASMKQVISLLESEKNSDISLAEALENMYLVMEKKLQGKTLQEAEDLLVRAKAIRTKLHLPALSTKHFLELLPNESHRQQFNSNLKETAQIFDGEDPLHAKLDKPSEEEWQAAIAEAEAEKKKHDIKKELVSLRKAVAIAHKLPGAEEKLVVSLNLLADAFMQMGRPNSARAAFAKCIQITEKLGKENSTEYATLLDHYAQVLVVLNEYDQAELLLYKSMSVFRKNKGEESVDLSMTLCTLAQLYLRRNETDRGIETLKQAVSIMEKVLKPDDERIQISKEHLADAYLKKGMLKDADRIQTEILTNVEKHFGEKSPLVLHAAKALAATKSQEGSFAEAESLLKRCLELSQQIYGEGSPRTAQFKESFVLFQQKHAKSKPVN